MPKWVQVSNTIRELCCSILHELWNWNVGGIKCMSCLFLHKFKPLWTLEYYPYVIVCARKKILQVSSLTLEWTIPTNVNHSRSHQHFKRTILGEQRRAPLRSVPNLLFWCLKNLWHLFINNKIQSSFRIFSKKQKTLWSVMLEINIWRVWYSNKHM